jgi:hypothetical protein
MKSIQASVIVPHRSNGPYRSLNRAFVWSWGNKMQKWIRQEEYMHIQLYVSMLVAFPLKSQDPHLLSLIIVLHIVKPSILRWGLLKVYSTRGGTVGCREWSELVWPECSGLFRRNTRASASSLIFDEFLNLGVSINFIILFSNLLTKSIVCPPGSWGMTYRRVVVHRSTMGPLRWC